MKAMLSQPMAGKTDEEIVETPRSPMNGIAGRRWKREEWNRFRCVSWQSP